VGLYEQLLKEQAEEERHRDGPLPKMRGLDSKVLVRRLEEVPERRPGYAAYLSMMQRLTSRALSTPGKVCGLGA
jgi:hypothetical protein